MHRHPRFRCSCRRDSTAVAQTFVSTGVPGETALLEVGTPLATGLHQVDNPVFDREGNLYVTYSGTRGQDVPCRFFVSA